MNDDFWNLGNEETTPDADDMVSESGHESTDTSLPVRSRRSVRASRGSLSATVCASIRTVCAVSVIFAAAASGISAPT